VDYLEELDSGTIERLGEQSRFLLGTYEEELAKDLPVLPRNLRAAT